MNLYNIIKSKNKYWLVDQIENADANCREYKTQFNQLLKEWQKEEQGYLSLLMVESYEDWLLEKGFHKVSTIVEYTRTLDHLAEASTDIVYYSLADGEMNEEEYADLYDLCRQGSANKNKQQPIEEVMTSIKRELGEAWMDNCYYFTQDDENVGIAIPHIEPGTVDEGRLFYFGVDPNRRGEGLGVKIHNICLHLLKNFHAITYVGSTDTNNEHMIRIFEINGSHLRSKKGIYRIEK